MVNFKINTIGVVGSGMMGAQISLYFAIRGCPVALFDSSHSALDRARVSQIQELEQRVSKGEMTSSEKDATMERIHSIQAIEELSEADLVIETVTEDLVIKRKVFSDLDKCCREKTILATNSSSIRISAIEDATSRLDRVLNLHFYPQTSKRPMVELMRGTNTSDITMSEITRFVRSVGLVPIEVKKESTGFVFNRIWRSIKKECLHLVDQGIASHEDVDRAWMIALGMPIGPFGLMDMVGLDVVRDIENVYCRESGEESDTPPKLLLEKIERGELGMKTKKGFYNYPNPSYQLPTWLKGDKDGA